MLGFYELSKTNSLTENPHGLPMHSTRHFRGKRASGASGSSVPLDPRFRDCQETEGSLDQRCASFEALLRQAPQDEDGSLISS
jgi:hypothetical protein